jgi:hypothetical protein
MFFSIAKTRPDNYPVTHNFGNLWLGLDLGWHRRDTANKTIIYKGYADTGTMESVLDDIVENKQPHVAGNFCVIYHDRATGKISIAHSLWRSFPMYLHSESITNLVRSDDPIWSDCVIDIDQDFNIGREFYDIIGDIENSPVSWNYARDYICDRLHDRACSLKRYCDLPIRVYLSGGIDSMLVYSFLSKHIQKFEIIKYHHVEWDRFWMLNSGDIKLNWGYQQIHHWTNPTMLSSGAPGDEFMLRSPITSNIWTRFHGVKISDLLAGEFRDCYHNLYFSRPKHRAIFEGECPSSDLLTTKRNLCLNVINDFQHWHLGETLTWTPLRDLEIFKVMLRLDIDDALRQIMNSDLSIEIIEKNQPGLSRYLSQKKNSNNPLANLADFQ